MEVDMSPYRSTKSEIDYIITDKKEIIYYITVVNKIWIGNDYHMVRTKISLNTKKERKLISKPKVKR